MYFPFPDWMIRLTLVLAAVGAVTVVVGSGYAAVWLIEHVKVTP